MAPWPCEAATWHNEVAIGLWWAATSRESERDPQGELAAWPWEVATWRNEVAVGPW